MTWGVKTTTTTYPLPTHASTSNQTAPLSWPLKNITKTTRTLFELCASVFIFIPSKICLFLQSCCFALFPRLPAPACSLPFPSCTLSSVLGAISPTSVSCEGMKRRPRGYTAPQGNNREITSETCFMFSFAAVVK